MAVYTSISRDELIAFLSRYNHGTLVSYEGIGSGIENTNYFVTTDEARYVLTVFEQHRPDELPFFLDLTAFLSEHDIPCAHPVANKSGRYLEQIKNKPAALVQRLKGASIMAPSAEQCRQVGEILARLHVAGQEFDQQRDNPRGPGWWKDMARKLFGHLDPEQEALLHDEMRFQSSHKRDALPRGIVHADLFRDNVLFEGDDLGGLIDFYYACTDVLVYDLAVTVNDWCSLPGGQLDPESSEKMLAGYLAARPLCGAELAAYPVMLRAAALRFWLSRLHDLHFPRPGEITHTHDPMVFQNILVNRRQLMTEKHSE
ncbi:MAG: homoserine kinase [Gammaproteobacteria bacterium]|nr:homoserine kinase [Gammaproteobacteria bacterium]